MSLNIVILAAGEGTRMYSNTPKVLHKIAHKPMLFHVIDTALSVNPSKIILVLGHGIETIQESLKTLPQSVLDKINIVCQKEQLGTGHALKCALDQIEDKANTIVLYGDTPLINKDALDLLLNNMDKCAMSLLTTIIDDPFGYGRIIRSDDNSILKIVEQKDADAKTQQIHEVNTGIICIKQEKLSQSIAKISNNNAQKEYYLTDLVEILVKDQETVLPLTFNRPELLLGVNNKLQLASQERLYQKEKAKDFMLKGLTIADPDRFDIRGNLSFGKDCFIDTNVIIEGDVILGDNVTIGSGCVIKDCTIGDNSVISPYSVLEKSVMKKHNTIGPFSRLRPGNVLEDEVHVGNFVEIKNSTLGLGTKSGHLSYLGDSTIGKDVNIGAGTITCNYDGAFKHKTVLGDDVFVGSDTQLVAPVTVANGVTIGAGSTVTTDIKEDNALYISRARGRVLKHYIRPRKNK